MFCKRLLALIVWCHCYQIVLNPFLQLLASSLNYSPFGFSQNLHDSLLNSYSRSHNLVTGSPIIVEANEVALTPGHTLILTCNLTDYPNAEFTWHRTRLSPNNKKTFNEEDMVNKKERYIVQNNVLTLKSPNFNDVADYYCRVRNPPGEIEEMQKRIMVRARPYIQDFDLKDSTYRSAAVEEGQPLKIVCNVVDEFALLSDIKLNWTTSRFEESVTDQIQEEEGIRTEVYNQTSLGLIIDNVTKDHRRFFKCHASNGITDNEKVILIRVKDKYSVVWPSLGILCEFLILLIVICIVENRRVEPDKEVYDHKAAHM